MMPRMARAFSSPCLRPTLLALLLALGVAPGAAADVVPLTYHPYPDDADPLGFPYQAGRDAFFARHSWRFEGIPPYPYVVVDGVHQIAGIPDIDDPMQSMRDALAEAVQRREADPPPITLTVASARDGDALAVEVTVDPVPPGGDAARAQSPAEPGLGQGTLWIALAEDDVFFRPPQAVSNGVEVHRFTVRAVERVGSFALRAPSSHNASLTVDPAWDTDVLDVVAWIESDAADPRFASREVLQAVTHRDGRAPTTQTTRGVLVEMLSATWCPPCIYGDTAVAELAGGTTPTPGLRYFEGLPWIAWVGAALGAAALAWRPR